MAELTSVGTEVTWGGPLGDHVGRATSTLTELAEAGATWAVCAWPESLETVAEAARTLRRRSTGPCREAGGRGSNLG